MKLKLVKSVYQEELDTTREHHYIHEFTRSEPVEVEELNKDDFIREIERAKKFPIGDGSISKSYIGHDLWQIEYTEFTAQIVDEDGDIKIELVMYSNEPSIDTINREISSHYRRTEV